MHPISTPPSLPSSSLLLFSWQNGSIVWANYEDDQDESSGCDSSRVINKIIIDNIEK